MPRRSQLTRNQVLQKSREQRIAKADESRLREVQNVLKSVSQDIGRKPSRGQFGSDRSFNEATRAWERNLKSNREKALKARLVVFGLQKRKGVESGQIIGEAERLGETISPGDAARLAEISTRGRRALGRDPQLTEQVISQAEGLERRIAGFERRAAFVPKKRREPRRFAARGTPGFEAEQSLLRIREDERIGKTRGGLPTTVFDLPEVREFVEQERKGDAIRLVQQAQRTEQLRQIKEGLVRQGRPVTAPAIPQPETLRDIPIRRAEKRVALGQATRRELGTTEEVTQRPAIDPDSIRIGFLPKNVFIAPFRQGQILSVPGRGDLPAVVTVKTDTIEGRKDDRTLKPEQRILQAITPKDEQKKRDNGQAQPRVSQSSLERLPPIVRDLVVDQDLIDRSPAFKNFFKQDFSDLELDRPISRVEAAEPRTFTQRLRTQTQFEIPKRTKRLLKERTPFFEFDSPEKRGSFGIGLSSPPLALFETISFGAEEGTKEIIGRKRFEEARAAVISGRTNQQLRLQLEQEGLTKKEIDERLGTETREATLTEQIIARTPSIAGGVAGVGGAFFVPQKIIKFFETPTGFETKVAGTALIQPSPKPKVKDIIVGGVAETKIKKIFGRTETTPTATISGVRIREVGDEVAIGRQKAITEPGLSKSETFFITRPSKGEATIKFEKELESIGATKFDGTKFGLTKGRVRQLSPEEAARGDIATTGAFPITEEGTIVIAETPILRGSAISVLEPGIVKKGQPLAGTIVQDIRVIKRPELKSGDGAGIGKEITTVKTGAVDVKKTIVTKKEQADISSELVKEVQKDVAKKLSEVSKTATEQSKQASKLFGGQALSATPPPPPTAPLTTPSFQQAQVDITPQQLVDIPSTTIQPQVRPRVSPITRPVGGGGKGLIFDEPKVRIVTKPTTKVTQDTALRSLVGQLPKRAHVQAQKVEVVPKVPKIDITPPIEIPIQKQQQKPIQQPVTPVPFVPLTFIPPGVPPTAPGGFLLPPPPKVGKIFPPPPSRDKALKNFANLYAPSFVGLTQKPIKVKLTKKKFFEQILATGIGVRLPVVLTRGKKKRGTTKRKRR